MARAQARTPLALEMTTLAGAEAWAGLPTARAPGAIRHWRRLIIENLQNFATLSSMKFVVIGLLVFASLSFPADRKRKSKGPDLDVVELSCHRSGNEVYVDGRVRNTGDKNLERLVLLFDFIDTTGAVITTREGGIEEPVLPPDAEAEFHARIPDPIRAVKINVNAQNKGERELNVGRAGPYTIE
jgi:hypothetical protein